MKDLPVFSALRDMHMQEQAPEKPPRKPLPPPAFMQPVPTKDKEKTDDKARKVSAVTEDVEMPLATDSGQSAGPKATMILPETGSKAGVEGEKPKFHDKGERTDSSQAPEGKQRLPDLDGKKATPPRENQSSIPGKSSRETAVVSQRGDERISSQTGSSPRKGKQPEEATVNGLAQSAQEKAKGKAKEVVDRPRDKESSRKKGTGFFSDSDEEEGPVIKRRKIMGGPRVVDSGDRETQGLKQKKGNVEKERAHAAGKEKTDDGQSSIKAADKKQRLALDERRSRQGTPGSDKGKSTSTTLKEKRPKSDATLPSRDRSQERERKLVVGPPRKNSQTSTSTRTGNDMAEDVETPARPEKKKKAGEGRSKAAGKSEINPLLPLLKEGALIWKWKGVHKRVSNGTCLISGPLNLQPSPQVLKVAWSPNLNKLAACSFDGQCGIFDFEEPASSAEAASGKLKALAKTPYKCSHRGIESLKPVTDVNWNPEGTLLGTSE